MFVELMCAWMNDNIIFGGDIVEGSGNARHRRDLEKIVYHLSQSK